MNRNKAWLGAVALGAAIGLMAVYSSAQTATRKPEKKADGGGAKLGKPESKIAALVKKLASPVTLEKGIDANTPLKDALEFFADHYDLKILINSKAFANNREDTPEVEATPTKLPIMTNVPVSTVLRLLLAQADATYLIRPEYIEVTSLKKATADHLLRQTVSAVFDKVALEDALQELSDLSAVSIVLDVRARETARAPVTATLKNDITVLAAARLLADMADLKAIRVGGALYVTTKENAKLLEAEEKRARNSKRKKAEKDKAPKAEPAKPK